MFEREDEERVRDFLRLHAGDAGGTMADSLLEGAAGAVAEEKNGFLALGFMRAADTDRYELERVVVRPDHCGMGLENQMVLTLELAAEKRRARWFGVWLRSDVCDDFSYSDINERMRFVERGYVFRAYRADRFGPGFHADRLDRELKDVLGELETKPRNRYISPN